MKVIKRGKRFSFRKRVPTKFQDVETRTEIWRRLEAKSEKAAEKEADRVWAGMLGVWEQHYLGVQGEPFSQIRNARKIAARLGYRFLTAERVAKLPLDQLLDRLDLTFPKGKLDLSRAAAILGGAQYPASKPSVLLNVYLEGNRDKLLGMSSAQAATWRQNRIRSIRMLLDAFGDVPMDQISNDELLELRASLWGRVMEGHIQPSTADSLMEYADQVLEYCRHHRNFKFQASFRHLRFNTNSHSRGKTFSTAWIQENLLKPPALLALEPQARAILLGMINTGYRLSEGANLMAEDIHLDCEIPHIVIRPGIRRLKTIYSHRQIPLVGVSLEAFRDFPKGFPDYRDRRSLSQKLNRYLRMNGLLETPQHSVKSIRHSLSDRLVEIETGDRVIRTIMGHKIPGTSYGRGTSLQLKLKYLSQVSIDW